ncbi:MAG TPA: translation elongation factor Ts [Candidatus Saccharimonadia bacterium]|nr:translation elongation factor Ts [Candidatus Saccharimonadia bacterium]
MAITIEEIKRLRQLTGVGITDAKQALVESKGDFDSALEAMRKKGITKADKRAEREARAGVVYTYNHDNRIGVVLEVNCETDFVARNQLFLDMVKDVAMHIAATNPEFLDADSVSEETKEKLKKEYTQKTKDEGKPDKILPQIVEGMLKKHFSEACLMDQPFIKNPDQTVSNYVKEHIAKLGENIVVRRFSRMALGEVN